MRPLDPRLRPHLAPARREPGRRPGHGRGRKRAGAGPGVGVTGLVLAALHDGDVAAAGAWVVAVLVLRGRRGMGRRRARGVGGVPGRNVRCARRLVLAAAESATGDSHRGGRRARHSRCGRGRAVPDPLRARPGPGRGAAAAGRHRRGQPGPAERRHRAGHAPAGPGLRRTRRAGHPGQGTRAVAGPGRRSRAISSTSYGACPRSSRTDAHARSRRGSPTITDRCRRTSLATLRIAFASSAVLELVATLSVALVAVTVGRAARRRLARPPHRAGRPAAGTRGLLAAATRRRRVPRRGRGRGDLRDRRGRCLRRTHLAEDEAAAPVGADLVARRA